MADATSFSGPFVFRFNDNAIGPHLFVQVCTERGWREYSNHNKLFKNYWNLWWKFRGFSQANYKSLLPWQFINRIPKGNSICRKDNLVRNLKCMKMVYGNIYDFSPQGYILPAEYTKLAVNCNRLEKDERIWICKPVGQSQGKGIFLFRKLSDLRYDSIAVVQRYIKNPLLIGGYKFDLRLYVCVPSYQPLTIYMYKDGIVRFATEKFSLESIDDSFRHLTNFSLNKLGPGYYEKKERVGTGCKWTFRQLRRYLEQSGYLDWFLWQRIACIVTLTILSQATAISNASNCFEFFGFDILIDNTLKPWLLEVNVSPALNNECEVDFEVKKPLLHDLFDLLGLPVCNTGLSFFTIWESTEQDGTRTFYPKSSKKQCKIRQGPIKILNLCSKVKSILENQTTSTCTETSECNPIYPEKNLSLEKRYTKEYRSSAIWYNGRDWRNPIKKEGSWIRIYPLIQDCPKLVQFNPKSTRPPRYVKNGIKNTVICVKKYLRTANEVYQKYGKQGDEKCNDMLQSTIKLETEIWLPNK